MLFLLYSHVVDVRKGERFQFLGFEVSWRRSGRCYSRVEPGHKAQQNLRANVRRELNRWVRHRSSTETVRDVNRIVRDWSRCFHYDRSHQPFARLGDWVWELFRSWLWRKYDCKRSRYGFFTNGLFHGQ